MPDIAIIHILQMGPFRHKGISQFSKVKELVHSQILNSGKAQLQKGVILTMCKHAYRQFV